MVYYVFGGDSDIMYTSTKNALFKSESLDIAFDRFNAIIKNHKYDHMYLICDFEISKKSSIFKPDKIVYGTDRIPFLIIADYHSNSCSDESKTIRTDTLVVKSRGSNHQFNNNFKAVQQFSNNLLNQIDTELFVKYKYTNDNGDSCSNISTIATTDDIKFAFGKKFGLGRIILDELDWENNNTESIIKYDTDGSVSSVKTVS
jgi:hypothetical protein